MGVELTSGDAGLLQLSSREGVHSQQEELRNIRILCFGHLEGFFSAGRYKSRLIQLSYFGSFGITLTREGEICVRSELLIIPRSDGNKSNRVEVRP